MNQWDASNADIERRYHQGEMSLEQRNREVGANESDAYWSAIEAGDDR